MERGTYRLIFILIPAAAVLIYVLCRLIVGKPLRSRSFNVFVSLLLLFYLAVTAGLGVFWVARHHLPVFDAHYLFGYATLILAGVHVAVNWKSLAAFFGRSATNAPRPASEQASSRHLARNIGWITALVVCSALSFRLGLRRGGVGVEVVMLAAPSPPAAARHIIINDKGRERMLADYYHEKTKHSRVSINQAGRLNVAAKPDVFKTFPGAKTIALPAPRVRLGVSVGAAIERIRNPARQEASPSTRGVSRDAVSLEDLATLLFLSNGATKTLRYPGGAYYLRAAPSAGALYPTDTYLLVRKVDGLQPGLYHYAVKDHKLHHIRSGESLVVKLAALTDAGDLIENAPVTFIYSAVFLRTSWKYGDRAYRYVCLDAGHVAVQMELTAGALGYGCELVGRFDDEKVNKLLGLDGKNEAVLLIAPLDGRSGEAFRDALTPAFAAPAPRETDTSDLLSLIHRGSAFEISIVARHAAASAGPVVKTYTGASVMELPSEVAEGDDLAVVIPKRRSSRDWTKHGMSFSKLASVLYYAFGISTKGDQPLPDKSVEDNHALNLYVLVNNIVGVKPGVYYYRRPDHALALIRGGDFRRESYAMSLFQDAVGKCHALFIMTIDVERLGTASDGDRSYRYALFDAGMLGGRVYLQAVGLDSGCCGIGAFFDDEASDLIGVSPDKELVIYMTAIGAPNERK